MPTTKPEVTYTVTCEQEDIPVRGNALASGDPEVDRAVEDTIIADLENGNGWAWCYVIVTASVTVDGQTFTGTATLGCCSYESEETFRRDAYFKDLCHQALADLKGALNDAIKRGEIAKRTIKVI